MLVRYEFMIANINWFKNEVLHNTKKINKQRVLTDSVPHIVQALYWINIELIATKGFFADFTSVGPLEHHIKMYQNLLLESY